jgi:hypothetical protein
MSQISPEITHNDIRKISRQFRDFACRLLRTDSEDGVDNLRRFLEFINRNSLISNYIQIQIKESGVIFSKQDLMSSPIPIDIAGEINFTYSLLMDFVSEEYLDDLSYFNFACNYLASRGKHVSSSKIQDYVEEFNKRVIHPFVNYIEQYLSELSIDLAPSNESNIINNSGTFNNIYGQNINALQGNDNNGVIGDRNQ